MSLGYIPRQVPPLSMLLDDLGNPPARVIARAVGVSERTVQRWIADDSAPRSVLLALFWVTRWGQSTVHAEAHNSARMWAGFARALQDELQQIRSQLAKLGEIGQYGSSNDPLPGAATAAIPAPSLEAPSLEGALQPPDNAQAKHASTSASRRKAPARRA